MIAFLNGLGGRFSFDLEHPGLTQKTCLAPWPYTNNGLDDPGLKKQQRIWTTTLLNIDVAAVRFALL